MSIRRFPFGFAEGIIIVYDGNRKKVSGSIRKPGGSSLELTEFKISVRCVPCPFALQSHTCHHGNGTAAGVGETAAEYGNPIRMNAKWPSENIRFQTLFPYFVNLRQGLWKI